MEPKLLILHFIIQAGYFTCTCSYTFYELKSIYVHYKHNFSSLSTVGRGTQPHFMICTYVTLSHLRSKEITGIHKPCTPHSNDSSATTEYKSNTGMWWTSSVHITLIKTVKSLFGHHNLKVKHSLYMRINKYWLWVLVETFYSAQNIMPTS